MSFENTRIYRLLCQIDVIALNRFSKFIHSPYFNKNQKLTSLFDISYNDLKEGNAVKSKEQLWTMVGFADKYKDIKFRKLCNDLVALYEEFITVEVLQGDEMLKSNLLIKGIKKNDNEILIEKHISKSTTIFDRIADKSSDFYFQKYMNEKTLQNLKTNYEKKEDIKKYISSEANQNLAIQLDAFYVIEKLRHAIDITTWTKQYKIDFEINLDVTLKLIEESEVLSSTPAIRIYSLIYQILTKENSKDLYFELKDLAKENILLFPKSEQAEIFDAIFSYCIAGVNKGKLEFQREYLDLNDWGIQEEFILKNGVLSPTSFRNYIGISLRMSDFERAENYIEKNILLLEESRRHNALHLNLARLYFYRKEYETVIDKLQAVNYNDVWYNINSKILLMATYYELDEIDPLYSLIDSHSAFLRREKLLDNKRKKRHLQFISNLKKIVNHPDSKEKVLALKNKIESEKEVVNKEWLLEKIEELL